ncbi:MAG: penicillin-binding protein 2 [Pseudonocardiaceae bacterium]|nr:penicillin-binding protein 2 [Pseudonocardiaceae bacterium]
MNTPLRKVALALMAMVVLLLGNATYIQVFAADDYRADPRNRRVLLNEYSRERGQLIADGLPLASSVPTGGELQFHRRYLAGPQNAPMTGYYSLRYGSGGIENAMDPVLNGSDGRLFVRRLSDLITGRDPRGGHVELSADPAVQQVAFEELASRDYSGAAVALRPDTGEVLAMASTPSYDPNRLASFDAETQSQAWGDFTSDENDLPLTNRATSSSYPPGSTFKLVTTAAALESGTATPDTQLTAAPTITLEDTATELANFGNNRCGSGETAPLTEALASSCNTAFAQLAAMTGEEALRAQAERLGIGQQDQRIPVRVAPSTVGEIPDTAALQVSGIGQRDVALTPLQNAVIAATIANDGARMTPEMVDTILAPDFSVIDEFEPNQAAEAMSPQTAEAVTDMMIASEENTSGGGKISGVTIASKTGTAERGNADLAPHVWYVAFAPAEDPRVAVAVVVEDGGDEGLDATGGSVASPIGRAVIAAALQGDQ